MRLFLRLPFILLAVTAGCAGALNAHLGGFYAANGGPAGSTPTPSASSSPNCTNGTSTQTATVVILMANGITAGTSSAGAISGYVDNSTGSLVAAPVTQPASSTIQFYNGETAGGPSHSAIGLTSTVFPSSFVFPSSDELPVGSVISRTAAWSTGVIPPLCFSQQFTVAGTGTYLFGDYTSYDGGMRGVLIAQ